MNNTPPEIEKLTAVKLAMDSDEAHREPDKVGKRFSKAEALRIYKQIEGAVKQRKLDELVANIPKNYFLIDNVSLLQRLIARLNAEEEVAVDTETTGVDVYTDTIVGMSFTLPSVSIPPLAEKGMHVYIPTGHDEGEQLDLEYVLENLRDFLYNENIGKILHNAIFDIAMFRRHGYDLRGVTWDTMIAMHLLNENETSFKLKDLAPRYLGVESDTFGELFGNNTPFNTVPLDVALAYAAKDTHLTYELYRFQRKHLEKVPTILDYMKRVEMPLLPVIVSLEANGYILDLEFAESYGKELAERAKVLHEKIVEQLTPHHEGDEPINLNAPQQVRPALSKVIGKELENMDAKKTLKPLAGQHELIRDILEYKKIVKLSGTYIDKLPGKQNPTTKRWHSRFNPMGTVTGRFSSGKDEDEGNENQFNVQNQPSEARKMFVAPPGKVLISADFKAQEIRCTADLSGEPVLVQAFKDKVDPYANMASKYYKRPYHEVNKNPDGSDTKERKTMKVGWLSVLYGTSKYTLAEQLGTSVEEAGRFIKDLFDSMPILSQWIKDNEAFAEKHGYVWIGDMDRKRRLPDAMLKLKGWGDSNFGKKNRAMRQGTNGRVQGRSAIQTKVTMIEADKQCALREGWSLWAQVHDEIIFELPEDFTEADIEVIRKIMTESYKFGEVENATDIEIMRVWGEGVTPEKWFANKKEA